VISLIGVVLLFPNVLRLSGFDGPTAGIILAAVGTLLSAVLILVGSLLFRESFSLPQLLRITGWAVLGTVLLGLILALISLSGVDLPPFAAATLLSVSTFAHVLIGVRDVQRIRATEVARKTEKLSVLNRLVRHNLRHEAQHLLAVKTRITQATTGETREELATDVGAVADTLSEMKTNLDRIEELIDERAGLVTEVDLTDAVETVASEFRNEHPEATITVDVPGGLRVTGGPQIRTVIAELVENAVVHGGDAPTVEITATTTSGGVRLSITDDGPGIDDPELSVLNRETKIDQLNHSQGLGLWFVRWVMDACGGELRLESGDDGTTVTLEIPGV